MIEWMKFNIECYFIKVKSRRKLMWIGLFGNNFLEKINEDLDLRVYVFK